MHLTSQNTGTSWTGLLLLLRCGLFLVFAFNFTGDVSVNLLAISSTTTAVLLLFHFWKVYKSKYLNALELSFILNLSVLAVSTYHVNLSGGSQTAVTYTSVCVAVLTFLGILVYRFVFGSNQKCSTFSVVVSCATETLRITILVQRMKITGIATWLLRPDL